MAVSMVRAYHPAMWEATFVSAPRNKFSPQGRARRRWQESRERQVNGRSACRPGFQWHSGMAGRRGESWDFGRRVLSRWTLDCRTRSLQPTPGSAWGLPGSRGLVWALGPAWLNTIDNLLFLLKTLEIGAGMNLW